VLQQWNIIGETEQISNLGTDLCLVDGGSNLTTGTCGVQADRMWVWMTGSSTI
jgi:hypothetical protein